MPTNPPPAAIEQSATEPTVYLGSVAPPEGAFKVYSGFARGTLSRQQMIEGNSNVAQELFLIGFGNAPTLQYNEINISNDGGVLGAFKVTLANFFVFPDGKVERVTQIVIVQPSGDIFRPFDSESVMTLFRNKIEAVFGPADPTTAPPNPSAPSPASSNIHVLIVSQSFGIERAFRPYRLTNFIGGIVALGNPDNETQLSSERWSGNLTVIPDQDLISGAKIPPVTPNIVDIRIRHYSVQSKIESVTP